MKRLARLVIFAGLIAFPAIAGAQTATSWTMYLVVSPGLNIALKAYTATTAQVALKQCRDDMTQFVADPGNRQAIASASSGAEYIALICLPAP